MKTILTFSAAILSLLIVAPADAAPRKWGSRYDSRDSHVHRGHNHDHNRVVYRRVMVGRAFDGCPIYRMVAVPVRDHRHAHGHNHGGHSHR